LKTEYRYRKIYLNPVFSFTQYYGHCQKERAFLHAPNLTNKSINIIM